VGLLATIDPFEQLKKGRDTSTRNTVSEFYNANLRYYSTKSEWPWTVGSISTDLNEPSMASAITNLINAGELKTGFNGYVGTGTLSQIYVTSTGLGDVHVCYMPQSKGFQLDPNTVFDKAGGTTIATCKALGGSGDTDPCYYCIQ